MTVRVMGDRLRIALSSQEVSFWGIELKRRDAASLGQLKQSLLRLLTETQCASSLFANADLIRMEVRADPEGGCVISCRADSADDGSCEPIIYAFENAEDLIEATVRLFSQHGHRILKSQLYPAEASGGYRLVVYPLDGPSGRASQLLGEYGRRLSGGALRVALLEEHTQPILCDRAVDTLCYYFAK